MRVIIAGSRDLFFTCSEIHKFITEAGLVPAEIVSGTAGGVDRCGEQYGHSRRITVTPFPAYWDDLAAPGAIIRTDRYGRSYNARAGHDRNRKMAEYADALLALWDGASSGTRNMIETMRSLGKPTYVFETPEGWE